ncbi:MAG: hypothetical protein WD670_09980, partial [Actinomycetota bacterium]
MSPVRRARLRSAGMMVAVVASFALLTQVLFPSALAQSPTPEPPPPTPVIGPGGQVSPSPFPSTLQTPPPTTIVPQVRAAAAVLADLDTGR